MFCKRDILEHRASRQAWHLAAWALILHGCGAIAPGALTADGPDASSALVLSNEPDAVRASNQVGALYTLVDGGPFEPKVFCSGVLIAPQVVLTAAHCVSQSPWLTQAGKSMYFSVSRDALRPLKHGSAKVELARVHGGYRPTLTGNDLWTRPNPDVGERAIRSWVRERCGTIGESDPAVRAYWRDEGPTQAMLDEEYAFAMCLNALDDPGPDDFPEDYYKAYRVSGSDLALIFLAEPITRAPLVARLPLAGQAVRFGASDHLAVGYGRSSSYPFEANDDDVGFRQKSIMSATSITEGEMNFFSPNASVCNGDSGGGLFVIDDGTPTLSGIIVRIMQGPLSKRCLGSGTATRILPFMPWIRREVQAQGLSLPQ